MSTPPNPLTEPSAFEVTMDAPRSLLVAELRGFWNEDKQQAFMNAFLPRLNALRRSNMPFGLLFDLSEFSVQPLQLIEMMSALDDRQALKRRAPTAVVVAGSLVRRQAMRVFTIENVRVFETCTEARGWLDEAVAKFRR